MTKPYQNERLFSSLKVTAGKRQFVLSGQNQDLFMQNMQQGLGNLDTSLREYLKAQGFEIIVVIDKLNKPEFLAPEMERRFQEIVRGTSVDPQAQGQNTRTFTPRSQREAPPPTTAPANEQAQRAQQTATEVASAGSNNEQNFLEQLTRLLSSPVKSAVVFFRPENMWMGNPTENDMHKLDTILRWSKIETGHHDSMSILVVNPNRLNEFNVLSKQRWDTTHFLRSITLPHPGKREFEAFLMRFACRYGYFGQLNKLAATAYSKRLTLREFSEKVREYVRDNPETRSLDGLFSDGMQAKTLEELVAEINGLVGLESVKQEVAKIIASAQYARDQRRLGKESSDLSYHMFFLGPPGTGKTMVARLLGQIFWALELRSTQEFVEIAYSDIISSYNEGETVQNMRNKIQEAAGGVLFVDEFYLFAENPWGRKAFEALMKEMEDNRDNLTVIFAGYEERLPELFKVNPGIKSRVNRYLRFPDYKVGEMLAMFEMMARKENQMVLTDEARTKLHRYLDSFAKRGGIGNGRGVRNLFETMKGNRAMRRAEGSEILPSDLPDPISFREEEARAIIADLEKNFVGLPRVKRFFKQLLDKQRSYEMQGETSTDLNHCIFLGNPGTGKTSVARQMGNLFHAMGLISEKNKLIEVDPISDFTSQYQAEYAQKVRDVFDRALGGVLFIDEAYQFAKDEQGRKVLDQIVKRLTEPEYANLVVVMAGYTDDMQNLYAANTGLKRRFPHEVHFDDFKPEELKTIFYHTIERDKKTVSPGDKDVFDARLISHLARISRERNFGNAGAVQNYYRDTVKSNQSNRLMRETDADKSILKVEDLTGRDATARESIDDIMMELDEKYVGMLPLKQQLRDFANQVEFDRKRAEALRKATTGMIPGQYNMRFVGNPGTGKTTIARYMARVFHSLDIIEHPRVVECRGVDLKASFVGQTKDRVNDLFAKNSGCVIVIDEVYSLYNPSVANPDAFGFEAIDTLVGNITDLRNVTTIVVLAGYKDRIDTFLSANQGLGSRFGTEINFPDYTNEECAAILCNMLTGEQYICPEGDEFQERLIGLFADIRRHEGANFGNARTVGGVFNLIKGRMSARVRTIENPTAEDYQTVLPVDVP